MNHPCIHVGRWPCGEVGRLWELWGGFGFGRIRVGVGIQGRTFLNFMKCVRDLSAALRLRAPCRASPASPWSSLGCTTSPRRRAGLAATASTCCSSTGGWPTAGRRFPSPVSVRRPFLPPPWCPTSPDGSQSVCGAQRWVTLRPALAPRRRGSSTTLRHGGCGVVGGWEGGWVTRSRRLGGLLPGRGCPEAGTGQPGWNDSLCWGPLEANLPPLPQRPLDSGCGQ